MLFYLSGCRESNPDLTHPMGKYYRYTTARLFLSGRRESNSNLMLPKHIYYHYTTPRHLSKRSEFGVPGIEPGSHEPESCILPLYYTPLRSYSSILR